MSFEVGARRAKSRSGPGVEAGQTRCAAQGDAANEGYEGIEWQRLHSVFESRLSEYAAHGVEKVHRYSDPAAGRPAVVPQPQHPARLKSDK
jgi:hypothetical protein